MNSKKMLIILIITNLIALNIFGQMDKGTCICPTKVEVKGPSSILKAGEPAVFTVVVTAEKGKTTSYGWAVSGGAIVEGQGTKEIKVDTQGMHGQTVTASVTIRGWCQECSNLTTSESALIEPKVEARLIDRMENPTCEDRQARMDNYFIELQNDPTATGYVFLFGSPRRVATVEKQMRANIKWRNFSPDRIVFVNGGGRSKKPTIELWLAPAGADIPKPTPPVENEADYDKEPPETVSDPKAPYLFSSEYYDGGACIGDADELDLAGYAQKLKDNPKSRGNIVILLLTKGEFREKEKEILTYLTKQGIARHRLKTFHRKTYGGVELWFLP